jgi:protease-4
VVELFGLILGGRRAADFLSLLNSLRDNSSIKSVIINIDSSGGLAGASDNLYLSVSRLAIKKPVVAFISGQSASGAYLVSCGATKIVALPSAVIGSIGVISIRPIVEELLSRLGIQISVIKSAHLKDMGAFYRGMTEEEKKKEQELIDSFHHYFVEAVAKGRRLSEEVVNQLATGEIFLAPKAKEAGLIDEIGDFDTALDLASQLGKTPRRVKYVRPRPTLRERLLSRLLMEL